MIEKPIYIYEFPEYGRVIVVGDEAFDWGIDSLLACNTSDPEIKQGLVGNIIRHLTMCFSEFIGRPIKLAEINEALERGTIMVVEEES